MKSKFILLTGLIGIILFTTRLTYASTALGLTGNVNFGLGVKFLDEDDWDPNDQQFLFALQSDFRKTSWPISLAADLLGSVNSHERDGADVSGTTGEIAFGVRKVFDEFGSIVPFIGVGPSIVTAHTQSSVGFNGGHLVTEDSDWGLGVWAGAGVFLRMSPKFQVGAGLRASQARLKLFREHVEAGGTQFLILGGIHF